MGSSLVPSMDISKPSTHANLEAAFGGESMANRKYLFFSEVAKQLGHKGLAKCFVTPQRRKRNKPLPTSVCCTLSWW